MSIPGVFPGSRTPPPVPANALGGEPAGTVPSPKDGVLLAFDLEGLVALARKAECVVELVPQVGDFVAAGSPLFRIFGGKGGPSASALCQSVALGQERTMEQDPAFAFRIIVDIASKGLSPAINDPTTAVLAIDQIHHLLRSVGGRHLDEGLVHDRSGALRLVYRTPDWEDFVCLAVTEIRQFGGTSIQVARRLRAMLENLTEVLPPERTALLRGELTLLHRSAERFFPEPEDQALADVSDSQGVGGKPSGGQAGAGILALTPTCDRQRKPGGHATWQRAEGGRHGKRGHHRAQAARRAREAGGSVEEMGALPERAAVGNRPRGLQRERRRLELLPPRPRALARLPLGRGWPGRHLR